uniref:Putative secreted protein n=1 Tax=Anopheles darlingi TaxID=43151 RepID=A0A2M4DAE6_ANODA
MLLIVARSIWRSVACIEIALGFLVHPGYIDHRTTANGFPLASNRSELAHQCLCCAILNEPHLGSQSCSHRCSDRFLMSK